MRMRRLHSLLLVLAAICGSLYVPDAGAGYFPSVDGEPWLGLATIGTYSDNDRRYQISIEDVSYSTAGDRAASNFAPSAPLRLRFESWFHNGGAPGEAATSAQVFLRYLDGAQIGTAPAWTVPIQPGVPGVPEKIQVAETTIHLDADPMNGTYDGPGQLGVFEIYAKLAGGKDNGADTLRSGSNGRRLPNGARPRTPLEH